MTWKSLATALVATTIACLCCDAAGARQSSGLAASRGLTSDPYLNAYAWPGGVTGRDALLYYLSSQHRQAQAMRAEQAAAVAGPPVTASSPYHRMRPGGTSAGAYFGRRTVVNPGSGPAMPSRYNRLGTYFGGRGQ